MDDTFRRDGLIREEDEAAALLRQYRRAIEAADGAAARVEGHGLCDRVSWLPYRHLAMQQADPLG
jgi:hypothetical protein